TTVHSLFSLISLRASGVVEKIEDEEGAFCSALCHGGGGCSDVALKRSTHSKRGDMQSHRDERVHTGDHGVNAALKLVLSQGEGAEAMPLWISQGSKPQTIHQLPQRQKGCQHLRRSLP
ncbi:hypothetical protein F2P56_000719, partial [Juglans regia]